MTLITEMMHRPLDPSYAAEAERRRAAGLPPARSVPWRMAVAAFLIGLLLVTAARTLRQPKDAVAGQKEALVAQIRSAQQQGDTLAAQQASLAAQIDQDRRESLTEQSRADLADRLQTAALLAGSVAAHGPGVVLTIDNAPHSAGTGSDGDPRTQSGQDMGKVLSRDLQIVVNGLWSAGAEAVSINGQRLTSTSAIRFAGDAILVDYRPLARPYVITALGDPAGLETSFTRTDAGAYIQGLADNYGVVYERTRKDDVTVPAGSGARVRRAVPLTSTTSGSAPSPASSNPTPSETTP